MFEVVQVKLRESGKVSYFNLNGVIPAVGEYVVIESDRGLDYGQVMTQAEIILAGEISEPLRNIMRVASAQDIKQIDENRDRIKNIMATCNKKIEEHKLSMKLIEAEYSFDRSKIVFYFTSEERVDFRDLVKDLAQMFKARIELKQIGVRDEAKMFGGVGPCGRNLCCKQFLKDFDAVTIRMAKDQGLPLNPPKISGICGRLMCCLNYEHKTYKELAKGLPRMGEFIQTKDGKGKVTDINYLKRAVTVQLEDGRRAEVVYPEEKNKIQKNDEK